MENGQYQAVMVLSSASRLVQRSCGCLPGDGAGPSAVEETHNRVAALDDTAPPCGGVKSSQGVINLPAIPFQYTFLNMMAEW